MLIYEFLKTEINYQDDYDAIMSFINSNNIRSGEYEGNDFIIKKMDNSNIIIYKEYETKTYSRDISDAFAIYKNKLIDEINRYAKKEEIKTN